MRLGICLLLLTALVAGASAEEKNTPARPLAPPRFEIKATLPGHTSIVRCVAFDPAGRVMATGGSDRTLRLWDPDTHKALAAHELPRSG